MTLTVLSVAYSLAPVGPAAVGGSEQILSMLDRALACAGHRSLVVAMDGSHVCGTLHPTPAVPLDEHLDEEVRAAAQAQHRRVIAEVLEEYAVDLVHLHGLDFHAYLPPDDIPVLATLHLPPAWYPPEALAPDRARTYLHCVSAAQQLSCPAAAGLLPPIENGVPVECFTPARRRGDYALVLGRICPEKGYHLALDAAHAAGVPLVLAGQVFGYEAHRRYFEDEITPRLDETRRFIGAVGMAEKRDLLAHARCLLVPSLAPETSSLVAMEALASGTPVIAYPSGALADIVSHGETGFLVCSAAEMADAIASADTISSTACRAVAEERFSADRMIGEYLERYTRLAAQHATR